MTKLMNIIYLSWVGGEFCEANLTVIWRIKRLNIAKVRYTKYSSVEECGVIAGIVYKHDWIPSWWF